MRGAAEGSRRKCVKTEKRTTLSFLIWFTTFFARLVADIITYGRRGGVSVYPSISGIWEKERMEQARITCERNFACGRKANQGEFQSTYERGKRKGNEMSFRVGNGFSRRDWPLAESLVEEIGF